MRSKRNVARRRRQKRRLLLEGLESRRLLAVATDLASISGLVFDDFSGNGYNAGEEVSGATMSLYRDNGDGVLESASDSFVQSVSTAGDGRYAFSRLTAGNYFVQQPAQTVGTRELLQQTSSLISISSTAVEGRILSTIDNFDLTTQSVEDITNDGLPVTSSVAASEAIGGERDLYVNKTSENGAVLLSVDDPLLPNLLSFDSRATGNGVRKISWDGVDGDALVIADSGLGGVDLTNSGESLGLQLQIGADLAGGTAIVRLYTDDGASGTASRYSTASIAIPQTGGSVPVLAEFLPFSQFTATGGGGVNFNSVGAIELEISGGSNVNGSAEIVGTAGQTTFTNDFANFESSDLSLSQTVDNASPEVGQNVTFTITVNNAGPDAANNVAVGDSLPVGMSLQSFSASQGTYDGVGGLWSLGTINAGASATLAIVARVDNAGTLTNFAEITAADQFDPDSTPDSDNTQPNDSSEDDQSLASVAAESIDLSIFKTSVPATVTFGGPVTLTVVVANNGASTASGIQVREQLPAGITFVSANPGQGSFNSATSIWDVGSLAPGANGSLTVVGLVNAYGPMVSTAEVIAAAQTDVDSTPANGVETEDDQVSVTVEVPQVDLALSLSSSPSNLAVGQDVTFAVDLSNAGPSEATGVVVAVPLPSGFAFVSANTANGSYNAGSGLWTIGSVTAGGNAGLTLVGRPTTPGQVSITSEVSSAGQPDLDSTPGNQIASEDDQATLALDVPQIDLSLTKTGFPATVIVGQNVTLTTTVTNDGPDIATGVRVRDALPTGMSLVNASVTQGTYDGATGIWTIGSLPVGSNPSITIVASVDVAGVYTSTAEIHAADQPDADSTPDNQVLTEDDLASFVVSAPQIDLSISKTVDNTSPLIGQTINFTITLNNAGPSDATGIQVRDVLPNGLQFVSSATEAGSYSDATGIWNVGNLVSGQSVVLTISANPTGTGVVTNMAEVINADQPDADSTPDNNQSTEDDQASVMVGTQQIDLSVTQAVDNVSPNVGENIQLTVSVNNSGPDDSSGISVRHLLSSGLNQVSATPSLGTYNSSTGVWDLGAIPQGGRQTLTTIATVVASSPQTSTAEILTSQPIDIDSTPGNGNTDEDDLSTITVTPRIADLSLSQTVNLPAANVGQNVIYSISVQNSGPDSATNLVVSDLLPMGLAFVNASVSQGTYDPVTGRWSVGSVAPGATPSLQLEARIESSGGKTNTAEIISVDEFDPDSQPGNSLATEDDQASQLITPPVSDLSIQKQIDLNRPRIGDTIEYTITVSNSGPNNATGVVVSDPLPSGLTFIDGTAGSGSYDVSSGLWTVGEVANGQSTALTIRATVTAATPATNTAEIYASDQYDPDSTPGNGPSSEDDDASVQFTPATANLSLTNTVDVSEPNVGQQVSFTVVVSNAGPDPATNLTVLDALPPGLALVSSTPASGTYDSASGIWTIGGLAVNQSTSLVLTATAIEPGLSSSVAQVQTVDQLDPDSMPGNNQVGEDDQAVASVTAAQIDLELSQSVDNAAPNIGQQVRFSIRVDNLGPSDATGVTVRDQLPSGLGYVGSNTAQGSYNSVSGLWNVGVIPADGFAVLEIIAVANQILTVENLAQVLSADQPDADSTPGNDVSSEDDQGSVSVVTPVADLSITKSANNDRPNVGEEVVYLIDLRNDGPDAATGVQVQDVLPSGLQFLSATPSLGDYDLQTGMWSLNNLDSSANATLQIRALVSTPGRKINGVELISADQADPDSSPNNQLPSEDDQARATIDPPVVDLSLNKAATPLRPRVNGNLTYTLLVSNDGPDIATGVVIRDILPSSVQFESATESVGDFDPVTGQWTIPSLAGNASATLQLRTTVLTPGEPVNRAEIVSADQFDSDSSPGNDDAVDGNGNDEDDQAQVTVVTASSDLELRKVIDDARPGVGSNVQFTLEVTNNGPDAASEIVVRDQLPAGMTFISSQASVGEFDSATSLWTIPSLAVGTRVTLDLTASVDTFGERENIAEIVSSNQYDPDSTPENQSDSEDDLDRVTLIPELVDLALSKVVDNAKPNVGEAVKYTLALSNEGPSDATLVQVTDLVPSGLTVTEVSATHGVYDPVSGVWNVGDVMIGSTPTLDVMVRVDSADPSMNTAEITAVHQPDNDSTPGNGEVAEDDYAEVLITPQRSDLSLSKSVNIADPNQSELILFTLIVDNDGPDAATNVKVRDLLPGGSNYVSSIVTSGSYDPVTGVWAIPEVGSGAAQSMQITARVESKVPFVNLAEVIASDQYDPDSHPDNQLMDEDDLSLVTVTPKVVDLSIAANLDIEEPNIDQLFEMTFMVSNQGPDDATGVELSLALPDGLTMQSVTPSRGVFDQGVWSLGALAEGEMVMLTVTATAQIRGTKSVLLEVVSHDQADVDSDPKNGKVTEDDQTELLVRVPLYSKRLFLSDPNDFSSDETASQGSGLRRFL